MKYFFVLGRNEKLSEAEVESFFGVRGGFSRCFLEENILVGDIKTEKFCADDFGGVLMCGKIMFEGKDIGEFLNNSEVIEGEKFSYYVFGDAGPLKEKFKREKRKAVQKHGVRRLRFQDGHFIKIPKTKNVFFLHNFKGTFFFGKATSFFDSQEAERRDMEKPHRRPSLAISPRLARILINLSQAREGEILLDPFCGVGGVLQEAIIKGINVIGADIDRKVVNLARENLLWIKKNFIAKGNFLLKVADAAKLSGLKFDAIATESPLGRLISKKISKKEAREMATDFERRIITPLRNLKRIKKDSKIAITFPAIRDIRVDIRKIEKETGLRKIKGPITEFRKDQYVLRDILVFK
ncbi:hypothetical protein D6829_00235 [Candidatus Pacearchaeota archaeon]|nr:MAG: hypothetical protein D6829_00235 [Candidatus Pacearchaeota archaeon]